jgi:hypothetical protein
MKLSLSRRGFLLAAVAGICLLPFTSNAANIIVGAGSDVSYLLLESPNLGVRTYEVHYTYNSSTPLDAAFLLEQAKAGGSALNYTLINYGTSSAPNYFVNSILLNGTPESGSVAPPWTYWTHWVSGGWGYQAADYSFDPGAVPFGSWTVGYGISARTIQPGSTDALFLSDGNSAPSVSAIPETSSALLALLGSVVIFKRRRQD